VDTVDFKSNVREPAFPINLLPNKSLQISRSLTGNDYHNVQYLSSGSNSLVYTAEKYKETIVIKMLKQNVHNYEVAEQEMNLEMQILMKLEHPNIVSIKGAGTLPRKFIEVDYLEGGTLDDVICKNRLSTDPESEGHIKSSLTIARELASALKYLHNDVHPQATVIHRDLKPQNIGFTSTGQLKLFDFGLVACVSKNSTSEEAYAMTGSTGTMVYMAPEVALCQPYNEKVDVYSFGILLWQLLSGETPFEGMSREEHMDRVVRGGQRPSLSAISSCGATAVQSKRLRTLLAQCWHADWRRRPSSATLLAALDALLSHESSDNHSNNSEGTEAASPRGSTASYRNRLSQWADSLVSLTARRKVDASGCESPTSVAALASKHVSLNRPAVSNAKAMCVNAFTGAQSLRRSNSSPKNEVSRESRFNFEYCS